MKALISSTPSRGNVEMIVFLGVSEYKSFKERGELWNTSLPKNVFCRVLPKLPPQLLPQSRTSKTTLYHVSKFQVTIMMMTRDFTIPEEEKTFVGP